LSRPRHFRPLDRDRSLGTGQCALSRLFPEFGGHDATARRVVPQIVKDVDIGAVELAERMPCAKLWIYPYTHTGVLPPPFDGSFVFSFITVDDQV
jgi:hypothetical protein